jgi:hypothetical protein
MMITTLTLLNCISMATLVSLTMANSFCGRDYGSSPVVSGAKNAKDASCPGQFRYP